MKHLFFILMLLPSVLFSQSGISLSLSTKGAFGGNIFLQKNTARYYVGASYQFAGQLQHKDTQLPNYGQTVIGTGKYFWAFDMGYGRVVKERFTITGTVSIGQRVWYTNYKDARFNGGGYSLSNRDKAVASIGADFGYIVSPFFEIFAGAHLLHGINFGCRFILNN